MPKIHYVNISGKSCTGKTLALTVLRDRLQPTGKVSTLKKVLADFVVGGPYVLGLPDYLFVDECDDAEAFQVLQGRLENWSGGREPTYVTVYYVTQN